MEMHENRITHLIDFGVGVFFTENAFFSEMTGCVEYQIRTNGVSSVAQQEADMMHFSVK